MDFDWTIILEFLYDHAGELVLGLEFFLCTVLGKVLGKTRTQSTKTLTDVQKEKMISKHKLKAESLLAKAKKETDAIDELSKKEGD